MEVKINNIDTDIQDFIVEVEKGLFKKPKSISSKFFYDKKGDELFQQIMNLDEYYLTNCEFDIFRQQKDDILRAINPDEGGFNLIELGAGDGSKTKILLKYFIEKGIDFSYHPVDISKNILDTLEHDIKLEFPSLDFQAINEEYFSALSHLNKLKKRKNLVLFLGSNIGNFDHDTRDAFFDSFNLCCTQNDQLLIGVDLKKDPSVILSAYSDSHGITAQFNLNLLERMNRELGANFNIGDFKHYATYNPENGEARSYLISMKEQEVYIAAIDKKASFLKSEYIHTEISKKYNLSELDQLSRQYGFSVINHFTDSKENFVDTLWTLK